MSENKKLDFDKNDLKKTKGSFQSRSNRLQGVLRGPEYDRLIQVINNSWESNEAKEYIELLDEAITKVDNMIKGYNNSVQSLIDTKLR